MDSPERGRYVKRDVEDGLDVKSDRAVDDEEWESSDKRKHRSSRSRKLSNGEDAEGNEGRKRSGGSSRAGSDEEDHDSRKESRSKQIKKRQEENTLEKLSNWYQDGELENKKDGVDKLGSRGHGRADESEKRKTASKIKSKEERSHDVEIEKVVDRDSRYSERRETGREKGHGSSEELRNSRRKWDESDAGKKAEETFPKEPSLETRRADAERSKSKVRSEVLEEDNRASPKHKQQRTPTQDVAESRDRTLSADEDRNMRMRDKNARERSGRRHQETDHSEMDSERGFNLKRKELEKDGYRDDRLKGRDDSWSDRNRDHEVSKENWKRRQPINSDKDSKNVEMPRHGRERTDNERPHGRSGNRKDGSRGEAVKTSSNFGISNENYDVIEIQTKPLDYGRPDSGSNFARRNEVAQQSDAKLTPNDEEWAYMDDRARRSDIYSSGPPGEDSKERYTDDGTSMRDQNSWRDDFDFHGGKGRGQKGAMSSRSAGGQSSSSGSQPPYGNQDLVSFNRAASQGVKGSRVGRGGRGRPTGRDNQQVAIPLPIMGSPFGPLGIPPPGPMQQLNPSMQPAPGPPMSPGVFIHQPFSPPVWPGARGVDMNMLAVAPGLSPVPPGPSGPRFPPNLGNSPSAIYFNQPGPGPGPGRGVTPSISGPAPSRGEQNDYSQNFVDTGMRPQNFIRELELTNSSFGTKFDVILVDPPWEEYVHRAPGVADHMEYWTFEEIMNLKIEAIADTPSFIFLWVGDGVGLEQGRQCLKKWGFRRCEDICWVKTNKTTATPGLRHDSHTLFQHSKEHCLMGIKGTVRRSTDGHIIHANIDTDVIIAEEPPYGVCHWNCRFTQKPEDMYRIIEHFALGRRRLELFGEDHNIRSGWLTIGKELSSSKF
ncbi:hypothetical protein RGQ29_030101 [Quercus rubra]|uniref:Methyltransferase-like protein 1 n=1 Tax=Quercus rubra TaxID=3512 RepID=A0AAN7IGN7_QUERU|nr:hypothetical protein RGQ29_030101 [Quercus rubra]